MLKLNKFEMDAKTTQNRLPIPEEYLHVDENLSFSEKTSNIKNLSSNLKSFGARVKETKIQQRI